MLASTMTSQLANVVVFTPGDFQRLVHTLGEQRNFVAVGSIQRLPVNTVTTGCLKLHLDIGAGILTEHSARVIGADIRLIVPGDGCLLCIGGAGDVRESLERLVAAQAGLELSRPPWHQQRPGSLRSVNQMAVSEGVRLLETLAEGSIARSCWVRIAWDELIPQTRRVSWESNTLCPLCARSVHVTYVSSLPPHQDR